MSDTSDEINYRGEHIDGVPRLRRPEYGTGGRNRNGWPEVDWSQLIFADDNGFDVTHREPNGRHRMKVTLPKHTRLIRYGSERGSYTAPKGTTYEEISLPYIQESLPFHEYEVIADSIDVECVVERGKTAPGFDYPGGGVQYLHPYNMIRSQNKGQLEEVTNA